MTQPLHYPPFGAHFRCNRLAATDGDSVKLSLFSSKLHRVRLLDCWCPFERGSKRWKEAKDQMAEFIKQATAPSVLVPWPDDCEDVLGAISSLSRWHAYVYINPKDTLNRLMVVSGLASSTKNGELGR